MASQVFQFNSGDHALQISGDVTLQVTFEAAATFALALAMGGALKKSSWMRNLHT